MEKINISQLKKPEDFKRVEIKIKNITQIVPESWEITLIDKNSNKVINIVVDIGQTTSILFGMSKVNKIALSPSIYSVILDLCKYNNMIPESVIIDHIDKTISKSKIELKTNNGLIYFDINTGDAIAFATINQIPIYTIEYLLEEDDIDDDNTIEIEF